MRIGETVLMAAEVPERFQPMLSAYFYLSVESAEEAERVYALLAEGGEIFMPLGEQFFASRLGMLRDRFGTSSVISHERPPA